MAWLGNRPWIEDEEHPLCAQDDADKDELDEDDEDDEDFDEDFDDEAIEDEGGWPVVADPGR